MSNEAKILEIGHIALKCANVDESVKFYTEVLGGVKKFELTYEEWLQHIGTTNGEAAKAAKEAELREKGLLGQVWITYIQLGSQFVELFNPEGITKYNLPDGALNYSHVALVVDDIKAYTEQIRKNGAVIDVEPSFGLDYTWQMWTHDPDGNKIEFMQYSERSFQLVGKN